MLSMFLVNPRNSTFVVFHCPYTRIAIFFNILYKCTIRQNKVKGMIFWKAHQNVDSGRHVKLLWTIVMKRAV